MLDALQHVIVGLAALGAAYAVVRRVVGYARPIKGRQPACPSCVAGEGACAKPSDGAGRPLQTVHAAMLYDRRAIESKGK
jgi:hypothetical protein